MIENTQKQTVGVLVSKRILPQKQQVGVNKWGITPKNHFTLVSKHPPTSQAIFPEKDSLRGPEAPACLKGTHAKNMFSEM